MVCSYATADRNAFDLQRNLNNMSFSVSCFLVLYIKLFCFRVILDFKEIIDCNINYINDVFCCI